MSSTPHRGRVYRRCACRGPDGRQRGTRCPTLTNPRHGTWGFAVDLPSLTAQRKTMRRGGFATKTAAQTALVQVLNAERTGIHLDDQQTVAAYLTSWLTEKSSRSNQPPSPATATTSPKTSSRHWAPYGWTPSTTSTSPHSSATNSTPDAAT